MCFWLGKHCIARGEVDTGDTARSAGRHKTGRRLVTGGGPQDHGRAYKLGQSKEARQRCGAVPGAGGVSLGIYLIARSTFEYSAASHPHRDGHRQPAAHMHTPPTRAYISRNRTAGAGPRSIHTSTVLYIRLIAGVTGRADAELAWLSWRGGARRTLGGVRCYPALPRSFSPWALR